MNAHDIIDLARGGLLQGMIAAAPILIVVLGIGALLGMLQTLTQIHDPSISNIPKLVGATAALAVCLPWMIQRLVDYSNSLFLEIPKTIVGG